VAQPARKGACDEDDANGAITDADQGRPHRDRRDGWRRRAQRALAQQIGSSVDQIMLDLDEIDRCLDVL